MTEILKRLKTTSEAALGPGGTIVIFGDGRRLRAEIVRIGPGLQKIYVEYSKAPRKNR